MTLTEIHACWALDAEIDKSNLDEAARIIPKLHARWWQYYSDERKVYRQIKEQQAILRRDKFEYFQNRLPEDRRIGLNWPEQPLKILRQDMDVYLDGDHHLLLGKAQLDIQETKLKIIEDILKQINNRNFLLKTMVEWLRFSRGEL